MKENKFNYKLINLTALMLFLYITISNIGTWYSILVRLIEVIFPFIMSFTIPVYIFPSLLNQALTKAGYSPRKTLKYLADQGIITTKW